MKLPRLRPRRDLAPAYGKGIATADEAKRALAKAVKAEARRAAQADDDPIELCLVGQTRTGADYRAQLHYWRRKARGWGVEQWPERLPAERYALFAAPLEPRAAERARLHPKPVAEPIFIDFDLELSKQSALAIVVSVWLTQVAARDFAAVALAPPILETYVRGRMVSREVVTYDLDWALPAVALR